MSVYIVIVNDTVDQWLRLYMPASSVRPLGISILHAIQLEGQLVLNYTEYSRNPAQQSRGQSEDPSPYCIPSSKEEELYQQLNSYGIRNIPRQYLG